MIFVMLSIRGTSEFVFKFGLYVTVLIEASNKFVTLRILLQRIFHIISYLVLSIPVFTV